MERIGAQVSGYDEDDGDDDDEDEDEDEDMTVNWWVYNIENSLYLSIAEQWYHFNGAKTAYTHTSEILRPTTANDHSNMECMFVS